MTPKNLSHWNSTAAKSSSRSYSQPPLPMPPPTPRIGAPQPPLQEQAPRIAEPTASSTVPEAYARFDEAVRLLRFAERLPLAELRMLGASSPLGGNTESHDSTGSGYEMDTRHREEKKSEQIRRPLEELEIGLGAWKVEYGDAESGADGGRSESEFGAIPRLMSSTDTAIVDEDNKCCSSLGSEGARDCARRAVSTGSSLSDASFYALPQYSDVEDDSEYDGLCGGEGEGCGSEGRKTDGWG
ncbi:hypothetical protein K505DRAFT_330083 [Melanomma pulvis-pyrius CBS 109.77]|uniref:Uncharacterized protein n=1 Tax=Melanomma pulvis-pyrius CBS 109.77 TaxID=1314802 RepID=A0A6A6WSH5_9PLEO|nr:hypothetical protein K505DRAFT_330083 [Melanomma pulvis-pyrius CBS 109.77]